MNHEQLMKLSKALKEDGRILPMMNRPEHAFVMIYQGKVIGKERPRTGNGHVYTPKQTREYEAKLKRYAKNIMSKNKIAIYRASVVAHLRIYDLIPEHWEPWHATLAKSGYLTSWDGADLDNREKSIFDALNGVVYEDDRQIIQVFKQRCYTTEHEGFHLELSTTGLTKHDLDNVRKMLAF